MNNLPNCPQCNSEYVYEDGALLVCPECAHEWNPAEVAEVEEGLVAIDANGNKLADGDTVTLIKDLKVKGAPKDLKQGTRVKNIRIVEGDHNIDCKIDGFGAMKLKSEFVKKILSMSKHYKLVFYSRIFLFLAAFTGVYLEIAKHGGFGMLLYYTVLSNLLVAIFTLYLLKVMSRLGENWQRPSLLRLKGGVTMSIMITCVIYHFLLAPIATNFYTLENFLCHYIVPLWFLADTLFFDKQGQYKIWDPVVWTILPLLYMIFALFNGLVLKLDVPNSKVSPFPYFFLNVNKGWDVVFKWCLIIFVAYMVAGFIFYFIKQIKRKSS